VFTRATLKNAPSDGVVTMLAPMVRCGTLPLRLLSLRYGADIVYTEELIAHKLKKCTRAVNEALGTVDFWCGDELVLRTCAEERLRCVVQIGAADADVAVAAVRVIAADVVAVDLNMGCPKHFSVHGGMGAALLKDGGVRAAAILEALISAFPHLSISCKVRLLATVDDSVALLRRLEATGVWCIAVHAREAHERPSERAHWSTVKQVLDAGQFDVPIVLNGDLFEREHIPAACAKSGCRAVMVARGALRNASIFAPTPVPLPQFWRDYVNAAIEWDASAVNIKYSLVRMLSEVPRLAGDAAVTFTETMAKVRAAKTIAQICSAVGITAPTPTPLTTTGKRSVEAPPESSEKRRAVAEGEDA
jgi:tRNA-dihydrouridine synthase 2